MKLALTGGFLGSGKTTAIVRACEQLMRENKRVAVITNDQGDQQVDSAFVKSFGIPSQEVVNGCFCCNYDQLDSHLQSIREKDQPDIIFAESAGSCADLIATIVKPLNKIRPEIEIILSVFADAELLVSLIEGRASFLEESVRYIYKKQLEEADIIIINKTDLLTLKQLAAVDEVIKSEYPGKAILHQNSLLDQDISRWLKAIHKFTEIVKRKSMTIDYDIYADGESKLAWLDKHITIQTSHDNCIFITRKIIGSIFDKIQSHHLTIGHLKFFLEAKSWKDKISFTTTSTSADVELRHPETTCIKVLINARVQTEPDVLEKLVDDVLANAGHTYGCSITEGKWSVFKPGYPRPTHRVVLD